MLDLLLKSIDIINDKRINGSDEELKDTKTLYMISPIFMTPTFEKLKALRFFKRFGFDVTSFDGKDLMDEEYLEKNPEAQLAKDVFRGEETKDGNQKSVGRVQIEFDKLNSKEWQRKKQIVLRAIKTLGIKDNEYEDKDDNTQEIR